MTDDPLLRFRDRFPILRSTKYLVSHSLGAMPGAARGALEEYADVWSARAVRAWEEVWWTMSMDVGDLIAPLLGAPAGSMVMLPNVTTASAVVISSLDYAPPRNRIVMVDGEFPSVRYVYDRLARRLGAEITVVPRDASGIGYDLDRLLSAIDERTRVVPLSHVLFESSFLTDAAAVAQRCRDVGAILVLDVFQSAGIVPIRLKEWGVPIAVGGVLKWLCGGPGGGFLYVDAELRAQLEPAFTGWMAHESPFSFEAPPMRFRDDPLRFGIGTPAIPALYAGREGPKIVAEAGGATLEPIRQKSLRQTEKIMRFAEKRGFSLRTPREAERRGGTVCMQVPNASEVAARLNQIGVLCDYRPNAGIRLSPHFYTTDEEIEVAFDVLDEVVGAAAKAR